MIARIEKSYFGNEVSYEFVECTNIDKLKAQYKKTKVIKYVGEILRDRQIKDFNIYGNTVISKTMLNKLGEKTIIKEVERITGYSSCITIMPSGTVILNRL